MKCVTVVYGHSCDRELTGNVKQRTRNGAKDFGLDLSNDMKQE